MEMKMEEGLVVRGRVEIDMRRPFKSVKEAVMLFGENILAGEVYAGQKLKQMESEKKKEYRTKVGAIAAELEETKQSLEKAKEEETCMAYYLASLKQELEETKSELKQLKSRREQYPSPSPSPSPSPVKEIEEIKFINNPEDDMDMDMEMEKKRWVKFASPPSLIKVMQETSPPSKKKTLIPSLSLAGIFSRKKARAPK